MMTVDASVGLEVSDRHHKGWDCCERMARAGQGHIAQVRGYRHNGSV